MSIVKSFSVGNGDMFYIDHNSDNFTIIDCFLTEENYKNIIDEIISKSKNKGITRFISTHPDEDHIRGLSFLDKELNILNFYCVENEASKDEKTTDFIKYCELRDDPKKPFYIYKGCSRKWMNIGNTERGTSGINVLWPVTDNDYYQTVLEGANNGGSPNNLSPIIKYKRKNSATFLWLGDLEKDFMNKIKDDVSLEPANILFAPHHGRKSGTIPDKWLNEINPDIIVVGEAPSEDLNYYQNYNTITQNTAGHIEFECLDGEINIYVSNINYSVDFLQFNFLRNFNSYYIGTINFD